MTLGLGGYYKIETPTRACIVHAESAREALDHAVNNMSYIEEEVTRIESDRGRYYMDDFCLNVQLVDQLTI